MAASKGRLPRISSCPTGPGRSPHFSEMAIRRLEYPVESTNHGRLEPPLNAAMGHAVALFPWPEFTQRIPWCVRVFLHLSIARLGDLRLFSLTAELLDLCRCFAGVYYLVGRTAFRAAIC